MTQTSLQKKFVPMAHATLVKNLPPYLIVDNAFQNVLNVQFFNGQLSKASGWVDFSDDNLVDPVMAFDQFFLSSGTDFLIVVTTKKIFYWDTVTSEFLDITGSSLTGGITNDLSTEIAFDLFVYSNGIDTIGKWNGASPTTAALGGLTNVEPLDGTPPIAVTTCGTLKFFKNFIVLLDVTENGTRKPFRVRWSRLGLPENWKNDVNGNGQAGAADVGTVDFIFTGETIGDSLAIYKERSIWLMTYIGSPIIFDFREVVSGLGLVGPRAVGNLGDEHIVVLNDDIYIFNGDSVESIGEPIKKYFFSNVNPKYLEKTSVFIVEEQNEAWVCYASTLSDDGAFDYALVYNYLEETWSYRQLDNMTALGYYRRSVDVTWANDSGTWENPVYPGTWDERTFLDASPINLLGDKNGKIYQVTGNSINGAELIMRARSKLFDFGDPSIFKRAMRVQLIANVQANYSVTLRVGQSQNADDDVVFKEYTYNLANTSNPFLEIDVNGRFLTFEFEIGGVNQDFTLLGYNIYFIARGMK